MPLRFRSVIPYTLPGVLALIGWYWYISRKKERLITHDSPEGAPTPVGLRTSPAEGSNGLVEKGTVSSPTNDTERPAHRPPKVTNQRTEHENISHIHVPDSEAAPSPEQRSEEAAPHLGRTRGEDVHKPPDVAAPSPGKDDNLQVSSKDHKAPEESSSLALETELEKHQIRDPVPAPEALVEEVIVPCQSNKVSSSSPATAYLSDAERPEPEGEVAKHHGTSNTQDELIVCSVTPAKVQRVMPSEADSLETPPSTQDFHQQITSTPNTPGPTSTVEDSITTTATPESIQTHGSSGEEQDLELLAAGLICEVISAATQEVLGVTRCQVTDNSEPTCSSSPLASSRLCSQQEAITAAQQRHHLLTSSSQTSCESREATEKEQQGVPNGCSSAPVWEPVEVSQRAHQTNNAQRGHWPTASHEAAPSVPLLNAKLKGDEGAVPAEDSACSTCHSEDGISSEDLQNSMLDNQMDVIQITDLSAKEAALPQSLVGTTHQ